MEMKTDDYYKTQPYFQKIRKLLFRGLKLSKFEVIEWGGYYEVDLRFKKKDKTKDKEKTQ